MKALKDLDELLTEIDRQWAEALDRGNQRERLKALSGSVALIRNALMNLPGITANIAPLLELTVALEDAAKGKKHPLLQAADPHKESGWRVRHIRARAVIAVERLTDDLGMPEVDALKLVSDWLVASLPRLKAKPTTIRDWRTDVAWNRSLSEEREFYDLSKQTIAGALQELGMRQLPNDRQSVDLLKTFVTQLAHEEAKLGIDRV